MNLLLLGDDDFLADGTVRLTGRRALHAQEVLKACAGDTRRVGRLNGLVGRGEVLSHTRDELRLRVELTLPPPPRPGLDLLLALPRPKALKKVLPAVASLGVDRLFLVNAARVEKSYFDSKVLAKDSVDELFGLGLEQARDTVPPKLLLKDRFRPFVEDELDALLGSAATRLVAHPGEHPKPGSPAGRVALAIGPEGGWVPFELELLAARGFVPFSLGDRILRVEVAVPYALGMLKAPSAGRC